MRGERQTFSRDQVQLAERRSWANLQGKEFYFDGVCFWRRARGELWAVGPEEAPDKGWQHDETCSCPLCREAHRAGLNATSPS